MDPTDDTSPADPTALEDKVAFLRRASSYPEPCASVEAIETHMSWVFLAGDRAYKLKKPVRTRFVDLTTSGARRDNAAKEVRLNRRLAPDVYLGVTALTTEPGGRLALDGPDAAVDWLVTMRRLPADRLLDRAIADGNAEPGPVSRAATHLARFFADADPVTASPDYLRARLADEIRANREALAPMHGRATAVADRQRRLIEDDAPASRRLAARRVVEGHGDLRPEHVYLGDPPAVIDCLEFSRDLRLLDPADELGYLALECERLGAPRIGSRFLETYRTTTGDEPPSELIDFYRSHRALVRARLAHAHTQEDGRNDHDHWERRTCEYIDLAERYVGRLP